MKAFAHSLSHQMVTLLRLVQGNHIGGLYASWGQIDSIYGIRLCELLVLQIFINFSIWIQF